MSIRQGPRRRPRPALTPAADNATGVGAESGLDVTGGPQFHTGVELGVGAGGAAVFEALGVVHRHGHGAELIRHAHTHTPGQGGLVGIAGEGGVVVGHRRVQVLVQQVDVGGGQPEFVRFYIAVPADVAGHVVHGQAQMPAAAGLQGHAQVQPVALPAVRGQGGNKRLAADLGHAGGDAPVGVFHVHLVDALEVAGVHAHAELAQIRFQEGAAEAQGGRPHGVPLAPGVAEVHGLAGLVAEQDQIEVVLVQVAPARTDGVEAEGEIARMQTQHRGPGVGVQTEAVAGDVAQQGGLVGGVQVAARDLVVAIQADGVVVHVQGRGRQAHAGAPAEGQVGGVVFHGSQAPAQGGAGAAHAPGPHGALGGGGAGAQAQLQGQRGQHDQQGQAGQGQPVLPEAAGPGPGLVVLVLGEHCSILHGARRLPPLATTRH